MMTARAWIALALASAAMVACASIIGIGDLPGLAESGDGSTNDVTPGDDAASDVRSDAPGTDGADAAPGDASADAFDASDDTFVCPPFPDGGWTCVGSNITPGVVCITFGDAAPSATTNAGTWCTPHSCTTSCTACDGSAMCKTLFDAGYVGCADPKGEVTIDCAP